MRKWERLFSKKEVIAVAVIRGWKFPIEVDENTGKIKTIEDNENVKQSIKIILQTQKFERKIVPTFGTDLRSFMFEVVDPTFISTLTSAIKSSLKMWEEHIEDIAVNVKASSGPVSEVIANIDYVTDILPVQERLTKKLDINGRD